MHMHTLYGHMSIYIYIYLRIHVFFVIIWIDNFLRDSDLEPLLSTATPESETASKRRGRARRSDSWKRSAATKRRRLVQMVSPLVPIGFIWVSLQNPPNNWYYLLAEMAVDVNICRVTQKWVILWKHGLTYACVPWWFDFHIYTQIRFA